MFFTPAILVNLPFLKEKQEKSKKFYLFLTIHTLFLHIAYGDYHQPSEIKKDVIHSSSLKIPMAQIMQNS